MLSGRTALDVAIRVRVGGIGYLGDRGLEAGALGRGVRAEGMSVTGQAGLEAFTEAPQALGQAAASRLGDPDWLFVESKGPSVAFHYRAAPEPEAAQARLAAALAERRLAAGLTVAVRGSSEAPPELVEAADHLLARVRDAARVLSGLAGVLEREVV